MSESVYHAPVSERVEGLKQFLKKEQEEKDARVAPSYPLPIDWIYRAVATLSRRG